MKTVTVTFPIKEAMEALRLLRAEAKCLIEQSEFLDDPDLRKRTELVFSARERLVSNLEEIADEEDSLISDPNEITLHAPFKPKMVNKVVCDPSWREPWDEPNFRPSPIHKTNDEIMSEALESASGEHGSNAVDVLSPVGSARPSRRI